MSTERWTTWDRLPDRARATTVRAAEQSPGGVVGASVEPAEGGLGERLEARRSLLLRAQANRLVPVWEGRGTIVSVDVVEGTWFALESSVRPEGPGFRLLSSADDGVTWRMVGSVPVKSARQLLAVSPREVWVLGANVLARSLDGGDTYTAIEAPGERRPHAERLRRYSTGVALVGERLLVTGDGGARWQTPLGAETVVQDLDGEVLVALREGRMFLVRLEARGVQWLQAFPSAEAPLRLASSGRVVRLLARPTAPEESLALRLYRSEDGGRRFDTCELAPCTTADIAGANDGLLVTLRGEVQAASGTAWVGIKGD